MSDDSARDDTDEQDDPAFKALLKRSLATPVDAGDTPGSTEADRMLLASVQRKIRQRSNGRFYADGWSTNARRVNYALIATIMLVLIVAVYLALGPTSVSSP